MSSRGFDTRPRTARQTMVEENLELILFGDCWFESQGTDGFSHPLSTLQQRQLLIH